MIFQYKKTYVSVTSFGVTNGPIAVNGRFCRINMNLSPLAETRPKSGYMSWQLVSTLRPAKLTFLAKTQKPNK